MKTKKRNYCCKAFQFCYILIILIIFWHTWIMTSYIAARHLPTFFLRGASKNLCLQPFRKRASSSQYVRRLYGRRVQMQWKVERFFSLFLIFVFLMNVFQFLQREAVEQTLNTAKDWLFMPMYKIDYEYRLLAIALDI